MAVPTTTPEEAPRPEDIEGCFAQAAHNHVGMYRELGGPGDVVTYIAVLEAGVPSP